MDIKTKYNIKEFLKISKGYDTIPFEKMTLEYIQGRKGKKFFVEPTEYFKTGIEFSREAQKIFLFAYSLLSKEKKEEMRNKVFTKNPDRFVNFFEGMWHIEHKTYILRLRKGNKNDK